MLFLFHQGRKVNMKKVVTDERKLNKYGRPLKCAACNKPRFRCTQLCEECNRLRREAELERYPDDIVRRALRAHPTLI